MLYTTTEGKQPLTIAITGQQPIAIGSRLTTYVDPARYHVFSESGATI
jgi:multiple sugar transport system ATP-binding protein